MIYRNENEILNICYEHEEDQENQSMLNLWRAVISQAIIDAVSNSRKKKNILYKKRAITWIDAADNNFRDVCDLANLDYDEVRKRIIAFRPDLF